MPHDVIVAAVVDALAAKLGCKAQAGQAQAPQEGVMMRDGATALARARSETTIEVELPGRSYAIVIGERLLASCRAAHCRSASRRALRRGERRQRRGALSRPAQGEPRQTRPTARRGGGGAGRSEQELPRAGRRLRAVCSSSASSAATASSRLAAAWSATSPASPPASCGAASASCRCRPRCWPRSIPRSAARPASTRRQGKNLIGTFHQPSLVLADIAVLSTLSPREFRAGYAEVVKYGLLGDAPFFAWLEAELAGNLRRVRGRAPPCRRDQRPRQGSHRGGRRARGRAARALCSISATLSAMRSKPSPATRTASCMAKPSPSACGLPSPSRSSGGFARPADAARVERHLDRRRSPRPRSPPFPATSPRPRQLLRLMAQDKKVKGGKLALVLVRGIGQAFVERDVSLPRLTEFLTRECARS